MVGVFEDFELGWDDQIYKVPRHKMMGLVTVVEKEVTQYELSLMLARPETINKSKLAAAYAAALKYAGCIVSVDEVYEELNGEEDYNTVIAMIGGLLAMLVPPSVYKEDGLKKKKSRLTRPASQTTDEVSSSPSTSKSPVEVNN